MKNSTILRRAALGPAPSQPILVKPPSHELALLWLGGWGGAFNAVRHLFPPRRSVGGRCFGGMSEQEARLALLLVAASEEWEGR
jgi:hypothetical protein